MSMNDSTPPDKAIKSVTRIPLYASQYGIVSIPNLEPSILVLARIKQPTYPKPTPLSDSLFLQLPDVQNGMLNRKQKLENDEARSTWTLVDQGSQDRNGNALTYTGLAEPNDINNRMTILLRHPSRHTYELYPVGQLNMQKKNLLAHLTSLEQVEDFNKMRARAHQQNISQNSILKEHNTIQDIAKAIMRDDVKKKKKDGSSNTSHSVKNPNHVSSKKIAFGDEGGEGWNVGEDDQWEKFDDDEEIKNRDLIDFEETGDWDGTKEKKETFLHSSDDEDNDTVNAPVHVGDQSDDDDDDDDDDDENDINANNAIKRKTMIGGLENVYQDQAALNGTAKRQKLLLKKK